MKITYDKEANALYIYLSEEVILRTQRINESVSLDFAQNDNLRGIEILNADKHTQHPDELELDLSQAMPALDQAQIQAQRALRRQALLEARAKKASETPSN